MLRLLRFRNLDLTRWDACLAAAQPPVLPYAQAWWLAATARRWAAVVELGPAGEYRSVLPLPYKWRPKGRVAYQPLFTQQLGLVLTPTSQHRDLAEYLEVIKAPFAQFYQQLPPQSRPLGPLPTGFVAAERLTYLLDLSVPYSTIYQHYLTGCRRRLRNNQALPQPMVVQEGHDIDPLISLFLSYRGPEHTGLRPRHYALLRRLYAALQARDAAELREVRHPATGELLAGALFVRHAGGLIYLFAATSPAGRAASAPVLLIDDALRHHAGRPGQVFDFEGGSLPTIGRFFTNFGATPVRYFTLTLTQSPWLLRWMRP